MDPIAVGFFGSMAILAALIVFALTAGLLSGWQVLAFVLIGALAGVAGFKR